MECDVTWFHLKCTEENLPFNTLKDDEFYKIKIKFVAFTKSSKGYQNKIIQELNKAMDSENENDCIISQYKYFLRNITNVLVI